MSSWNEVTPPDEAWRPSDRVARAISAAEQDRAAGGRKARQLWLRDGETATASISLRRYKKTRRIRAYLRWYHNGRTHERYVGEVNLPTRDENLAAAWAMAHRRCLLGPVPASAPPNSWASSPAVRSVMRGNKARDTKPEIALRSRLHARGLRFRVDKAPIPGLRRRADLLFIGARVAVFVDGCYWHGCPEHYRPARLNAEFWSRKIEANKSRDADTDRRLTDFGWHVIRIWEHERIEDAARRIEETVRARRG